MPLINYQPLEHLKYTYRTVEGSFSQVFLMLFKFEKSKQSGGMLYSALQSKPKRKYHLKSILGKSSSKEALDNKPSEASPQKLSRLVLS